MWNNQGLFLAINKSLPENADQTIFHFPATFCQLQVNKTVVFLSTGASYQLSIQPAQFPFITVSPNIPRTLATHTIDSLGLSSPCKNCTTSLPGEFHLGILKIYRFCLSQKHTCQDPRPNKGILTSFVRFTVSTLAPIVDIFLQFTPKPRKLRVALTRTRNITDLSRACKYFVAGLERRFFRFNVSLD